MLMVTRWWGKQTTIINGLVLVSASLWNVGSHFNSLDMGVAGCMTMALGALLLTQHPGATCAWQRDWVWACWVSMALTVLNKGPIGVALPGPVLVVCTLIACDWMFWKYLHFVIGLVISFTIGAPWLVLVSIHDPKSVWLFFIHEHFQRFMSTVHNRNASLWYFVPLLVAGLLPWLA